MVYDDGIKNSVRKNAIVMQEVRKADKKCR